MLDTMKPFIGREKERRSLEDLSRSGRSCIVVIKGHRGIEKSRLVEEFGKRKVFLPFSGLSPAGGVTAQKQLNAFAGQLAALFHLPPFTVTDWSDAFAHLTRRLTKQPTVIFFDEISWMGSKDPTFIPKLKVWWDLALQNHSSVILILCGSDSTWIDKNIIYSTALFGRISLYMELTELSILPCI